MSVFEYHQHRTERRQEDKLLLENMHGSLFANQFAHDRLEFGISLYVWD